MSKHIDAGRAPGRSQAGPNPLGGSITVPGERGANGFGKVAVLLGGDSAEREVSLMSGNGVLKALRDSGVDAHPFDPSQRGLHELKQEGFERVFIALHGRHGEDGTVQGALELLGLPYTGSGVMASAVALDKVMTKRIWQSFDLPTPRWQWLGANELTPERTRLVPDDLGLPLIVKPPREGSSIGVTKVLGYSQMQDAVALASKYDPDVLCEEFIDGIEVTCPVLGEGASARALPVVRIQAPDGNYDFEHKYYSEDTGYHCPSGLPALEEAEIQRIVLAAYRALGCRGWGRADLMIRARDRQAFLLEMNTSPGMTSHSLVPMSARAAGISYEALCVQLLRLASLDSAASGLAR
jgi:D-alanine-D-alanine ligase